MVSEKIAEWGLELYAVFPGEVLWFSMPLHWPQLYIGWNLSFFFIKSLIFIFMALPVQN